MSEKRVTLAAIAGAHGIGGEVRLKLFSESIESFKAFETFEAAGRTLTLKSVRATGKMPIARFAEIADRNEAEALRGAELTVARDSLPELGDDEYYYSDLEGLSCTSTTGDHIGRCIAVYNFGAGDVIEIQRPDKTTFLVPLNSKAVREWRQRIVVEADFVD
ncbi:ribosome maturation factor RimM [uncultured Parasphingopyxis sp.]|uniref:ribosome maturation factor RimM n=1 Tax=uncultured Parasphingopyxis sp. TaxID=1547918 RepID=UPI0026040388|nr:ribosome maturation factor RimM [uncultured Parasphingopyxis sp.]